METNVERAEVWAAALKDQPGALAEKLESLSDAGADLDFIVARRLSESPGKAVVFVAPLTGNRQTSAAKEAGFKAADSMHSVRIEGENRPGVAAEISSRLAEAGINMRGLSGAVVGDKYIAYFAFDSDADADKAMEILQSTFAGR